MPNEDPRRHLRLGKVSVGYPFDKFRRFIVGEIVDGGDVSESIQCLYNYHWFLIADITNIWAHTGKLDFFSRGEESKKDFFWHKVHYVFLTEKPSKTYKWTSWWFSKRFSSSAAFLHPQKWRRLFTHDHVSLSFQISWAYLGSCLCRSFAKTITDLLT